MSDDSDGSEAGGVSGGVSGGGAGQTPPTIASLLGAAGVLPFVALAGAAVTGFEPFGRPPVMVLALYALAILSFMGAIHWGLAMARDQADASGPASGPDAAWSYVASVVPALVGWFAVAFLPNRAALWVMAVMFAALLLYDLRAVRIGLAPAWYPRLRVPLSVVVVAALAVTALAAP